MYKWVLTSFIFFTTLAADAQSINVRGKVVDASGKAIANATLSLVKQGSQATSGADGSYSIMKSVSIYNQGSSPRDERITFDNGALELSVAFPAPLEIGIFDVKGNLVDKMVFAKQAAGVYRIDLSGRFLSERLLIVKASVGKQARMFRYFPAAPSGDALPAALLNVDNTGATLAKVAAAVDSLRVSATGYSTTTVPLTSYDTTVNVTLNASAGGDDRWGGLKNPPMKSAGCGKATTVTTGKKTITSGGQSRGYIIDIPADYDPAKPYRLFYCSHWIGSTDDAIATGQVTNGGAANWGYYGLKRMATAANEPAIFIAPQALPGNPGGTWSSSSPVDQVLFDDIIAYAKTNLCIDESRVFATGFSFGGMMTYSLSTTKQKVLRAAVGIAPTNFNIYLPNPIPHDPIAWMSTTGMSDNTCAWDAGTNRGAKYIALQRGQDNGCTVPATIPTWTSASPTRHLCYDFSGCKTGYPVKACTFNGIHQAAPYDAGSGDNGLTSWIPTESWNFFTQF